MENKEEGRPSQTSSEGNRDKHVNYFADDEEDSNTSDEGSVESRRKRHDADSGDDFANEISQREKRIDPGNEHHHRVDADDEIFDSDVDRSPRSDADAGGDGTGTEGPEPGE